jgi:hypothetical protein
MGEAPTYELGGQSYAAKPQVTLERLRFIQAIYALD